MNKKIENKIVKWYGSSFETKVWLAKHWYRYITYGCPKCYIENCGCNSKGINDPKGFAELAEYCYNDKEYGKHWRNK